jgi:hypothetical protein
MTFIRSILDPMMWLEILRSVICTGRPILENRIFSLTYADRFFSKLSINQYRVVFLNKGCLIDSKIDLCGSTPLKSLC